MKMEDAKAVIDRSADVIVTEPIRQAINGRKIDAGAIIMPMLETETDEKWMRVAQFKGGKK